MPGEAPGWIRVAAGESADLFAEHSGPFVSLLDRINHGKLVWRVWNCPESSSRIKHGPTNLGFYCTSVRAGLMLHQGRQPSVEGHLMAQTS